MRIDLEFIKTAEPIFLAGVNLGDKLTPHHKEGMLLWYDTDAAMAFIYYKGKVAPIQHTTTMTLSDPKQWGIDVKELEKKIQAQLQKKAQLNPHPHFSNKIPVNPQASGPGIGLTQTVSAQVSTPIDKVQGGKTKKFAKFQGEESQGE